ncbi:uncharacterized protein PHALS_09395 [Plasmopara halstedii]|uniref:Uncharacterized protein n=1 Tax=Plasmopara halstedii TaxID=4781 RepID=A0A0P1A464_PLAHL|nr:uncharacterized protein PHALS_09395 [Plasmopara halstedii]CEG35268.1 hypothetical protein PHALS_09395 [Plasmopara halstedii]|eukprot:XP_024571637.1 hypothetical protein PHALS_09395 [Plasmopara halstedii]
MTSTEREIVTWTTQTHSNPSQLEKLQAFNDVQRGKVMANNMEINCMMMIYIPCHVSTRTKKLYYKHKRWRNTITCKRKQQRGSKKLGQKKGEGSSDVDQSGKA